METNSNTPEAKQPASAGCHLTTCSPSSDPPLTVYENRGGEVWERHQDGRRELFAEDIIRKLTKLESQRNAAWKTLKEIRIAFTEDETFGETVELLFSKPLEDAEAEIERLNSLLNVKEHATLSAGANVDHGVEVESKGEHVNRAADRGCCVSTCSL